MALRNDFGFAYEYTYQDHEYIIRTMNTKHAQHTLSRTQHISCLGNANQL